MSDVLRAFPDDDPIHFSIYERENQYCCRVAIGSCDRSKVFIVGGIEDGPWLHTVLRVETPQFGDENQVGQVETTYSILPIHRDMLITADNSIHLRRYAKKVEKEFPSSARGDVMQIVVQSGEEPHTGVRVPFVSAMQLSNGTNIHLTPQLTHKLGSMILSDAERQAPYIFDVPGLAIKNDIRLVVLV